MTRAGAATPHSATRRCSPKGIIQPDTPEKFEAFLHKYPVSRIAFDSPGGNLEAGVRMGYIIRRHEMNTRLGTEYTAYHDALGRETTVLSDRPICASACAYAFLGGISRTVDEGAPYGLHQFRSAGTRIDEGNVQRLTVLLAGYVEAMGADRRLLDRASLTSASSMAYLSRSELREYGVDTSRPPFEDWDLLATPAGIPLIMVVQPHDEGRWVVLMLQPVSSMRYVLIVYSILRDEHFVSRKATMPLGTMPDRGRLDVDSRSYPLLGVSAWKTETIKGRQSITAQFLLSAQAVAALRHARTMHLDTGLPRAYIDIDPSGEFSTTGLANFMALAERAAASYPNRPPY